MRHRQQRECLPTDLRGVLAGEATVLVLDRGQVCTSAIERIADAIDEGQRRLGQLYRRERVEERGELVDLADELTRLLRDETTAGAEQAEGLGGGGRRLAQLGGLVVALRVAGGRGS